MYDNPGHKPKKVKTSKSKTSTNSKSMSKGINLKAVGQRKAYRITGKLP